MKTSPAQLRANDKYKKANTKQYNLILHKVNDEDIIAWLESKDNKQGYLKELIREDIKKVR